MRPFGKMGQEPAACLNEDQLSMSLCKRKRGKEAVKHIQEIA